MAKKTPGHKGCMSLCFSGYARGRFGWGGDYLFNFADLVGMPEITQSVQHAGLSDTPGERIQKFIKLSNLFSSRCIYSLGFIFLELMVSIVLEESSGKGRKGTELGKIVYFYSVMCCCPDFFSSNEDSTNW